jgi:hypothetical protein
MLAPTLVILNDQNIYYITILSLVFWVIVPIGFIGGQPGFGKTCCLHLQDRSVLLITTLLHGIIAQKTTAVISIAAITASQ